MKSSVRIIHLVLSQEQLLKLSMQKKQFPSSLGRIIGDSLRFSLQRDEYQLYSMNLRNFNDIAISGISTRYFIKSARRIELQFLWISSRNEIIVDCTSSGFKAISAVKSSKNWVISEVVLLTLQSLPSNLIEILKESSINY